jgi:isoamylase
LGFGAPLPRLPDRKNCPSDDEVAPSPLNAAIGISSIPTRAHNGDLVWDHAPFGYTIDHPDDDLSFDERDSAPLMPKSVVVDPSFDWHGQSHTQPIPWDLTILYETHLRGYTKNHPKVPEAHRGSYKGMQSERIAF